MKADVAIVGAGPTGCFVGKCLAERGLEVVIVEEHGEVGNPVCCTGIVGAGGLEELGIKQGKWVLGKLRGATIYPPSNEPIRLTTRRVEAFIIDRAEFDRSLATAAARAGATLLLKRRCLDLSFDDGPVIKMNGKESELKARVVVGADGPASIVARKAGLIKSSKYIKCAQVETIAEASDGIAEVYFSRSFAPGFFSWLVKAGDVCRVGLGATEGNPNQMLKSFMTEHPVVSRKVGGKTLGACAGIIPECLSRKMCSGSVLLVGDAAGQVKPLTGGGIYFGLSCAKLAVEAVGNAIESGEIKRLQEYESAVMGKFGVDFELGIRARRLFEQIPDEDLNILFKLMERDNVKEIILENFDFDHHEKLVRALMLKAPEMLGSIGIKRALKYAKFLAKP
ncbi:MAG: NAD(P)/FAD-dependent oxidoreductase [Methanobacteriota archaeon]